MRPGSICRDVLVCDVDTARLEVQNWPGEFRESLSAEAVSIRKQIEGPLFGMKYVYRATAFSGSAPRSMPREATLGGWLNRLKYAQSSLDC